MEHDETDRRERRITLGSPGCNGRELAIPQSHREEGGISVAWCRVSARPKGEGGNRRYKRHKPLRKDLRGLVKKSWRRPTLPYRYQ